MVARDNFSFNNTTSNIKVLECPPGYTDVELTESNIRLYLIIALAVTGIIGASVNSLVLFLEI